MPRTTRSCPDRGSQLVHRFLKAVQLGEVAHHLVQLLVVDPQGGQQVFVRNGEARLAQGNLAGSTLTLERAVRNVMCFAGITLSQAVQMATANVADALGLCDRGRIRTGLRADLCLLDRNLEVAKTMVAGKFEFER